MVRFDTKAVPEIVDEEQHAETVATVDKPKRCKLEIDGRACGVRLSIYNNTGYCCCHPPEKKEAFKALHKKKVKAQHQDVDISSEDLIALVRRVLGTGAREIKVRDMASYILCENFGRKHADLASLLGYGHHSSVYYNVKRFRRYMDDRAVQRQLDEIRAQYPQKLEA
jgi:hypothetical protein